MHNLGFAMKTSGAFCYPRYPMSWKCWDQVRTSGIAYSPIISTRF